MHPLCTRPALGEDVRGWAGAGQERARVELTHTPSMRINILITGLTRRLYPDPDVRLLVDTCFDDDLFATQTRRRMAATARGVLYYALIGLAALPCAS